jgi:hypothetical protein
MKRGTVAAGLPREASDRRCRRHEIVAWNHGGLGIGHVGKDVRALTVGVVRAVLPGLMWCCRDRVVCWTKKERAPQM